MIKLSKAGKMPCKSFSLQARETCPGSVFPDGTLKPVCASCYAMKGRYTFQNVKDARSNNYEETLKESFVPDMVELINEQKSKYFRWFDSGDVYSEQFLHKILLICEQTPKVKHWIPTQSRELFNHIFFGNSQSLWETLESLPNVKVRYSSPSITGKYSFADGHGSTVSQTYDENHIQSRLRFQCPSSVQDGQCKSCRACWSKKIRVINYIFH